jgi:hypothetical protein
MQGVFLMTELTSLLSVSITPNSNSGYDLECSTDNPALAKHLNSFSKDQIGDLLITAQARDGLPPERVMRWLETLHHHHRLSTPVSRIYGITPPNELFTLEGCKLWQKINAELNVQRNRRLAKHVERLVIEEWLLNVSVRELEKFLSLARQIRREQLINNLYLPRFRDSLFKNLSQIFARNLELLFLKVPITLPIHLRPQLQPNSPNIAA